jgi:hypothetical protein
MTISAHACSARSSSPSTPRLFRSEVSGSWRRRAACGWLFQSVVLARETERETGVSRASTTGAHGIDFAYRFGAAA